MKKVSRRFAEFFVVGLVMIVMLAYAACGDDEPSQVCDPGLTQDCSCGGGRIGFQTCESTGLAWGVCGNCDSSPDCPADRDCTGRECGPEPVCDTSCGSCSGSDTCSAGGVCVPPTTNCPADRDCSGRECGSDPVCGTSCGTCSGSDTCEGGTCVSPTNPCSSADTCFTCVMRSGCGWCATADYCVIPGIPCSDLRTDVDSCSGGSTWDAAACSTRGGYWASLNLDGGGGGSGCWFAASTDNVSCATVCSGHGLRCKSGNWNDNSSNSICLHFFPSSYPAYRNNPQGGGEEPAQITLSGTSYGCTYRCPLGHDCTSFEGCSEASPSGVAKDCNARGAYKQPICVCEP